MDRSSEHARRIGARRIYNRHDRYSRRDTSKSSFVASLQFSGPHRIPRMELGSLLQADELTAVGIKVKDSGVEKEIAKVKNVEKIMVCYQTGENIVREEGEVVMQLRLVSPNGESLFLEQEGSGSFTSKENGQEIRFSKAASFNFDGGNKKVCIYWSHNIAQAGTYTAEMYQEGYLLGMTNFELK